jgi:cytochrome c peroxidase
MAPPPGAEFVVEAVDDPYGFATTTRLSLFRRPLPTTNLAFLSTLMWDGRESFGQALHADLAHQADTAALEHAETGRALTPEQRAAIVDFEVSLVTAQVRDNAAGRLTDAGAAGGPQALLGQRFLLGGDRPPDAASTTFTLFGPWAGLAPPADLVGEARQAVALGEDLFNNLKFGETGLTCSGCHDAPNAGGAARTTFFDHGLANGTLRPRDPALPLYTLRCGATGAVVRTTDPGRALVTGRCADIGRFKVPALRGLAARAPYFHDGSAATLDEVVLLYDGLFRIGLRKAQKDALVAFLRVL